MQSRISAVAVLTALLLNAPLIFASDTLAKPPGGTKGYVQIGATDTNGQVFYLAEASQYAAYYGQLFKTPVLDRKARPVEPVDLTFTVTRVVGAPSKFRVLIVEVDGDLTAPTNVGAVTFVPTTVLWESQDLTVTAATAVTVTFADLRLDAGRTYAFLLDAYVLFDGSPNYAEFSASASSYGDGYFFFLPNPPGSSRVENFGRTWIAFADPGIDLEFVMRFKAKPARPVGRPSD